MSLINKQVQFLSVLLALAISFPAFANSNRADLSSQSTGDSYTYQIKDGYGEYTGRGSTMIEASAGARNSCIWQKIQAYEARYNQTPDADTADLFIDACINK